MCRLDTDSNVGAGSPHAPKKRQGDQHINLAGDIYLGIAKSQVYHTYEPDCT